MQNQLRPKQTQRNDRSEVLGSKQWTIFPNSKLRSTKMVNKREVDGPFLKPIEFGRSRFRPTDRARAVLFQSILEGSCPAARKAAGCTHWAGVAPPPTSGLHSPMDINGEKVTELRRKP